LTIKTGNHKPFIPNYGERYRYGEAISSAMAESTVNQLISKETISNQGRTLPEDRRASFFARTRQIFASC